MDYHFGMGRKYDPWREQEEQEERAADMASRKAFLEAQSIRRKEKENNIQAKQKGTDQTIASPDSQSEKLADDVAAKVSSGQSVDLGGMAGSSGSTVNPSDDSSGGDDVPEVPDNFINDLNSGKGSGSSMNKNLSAEMSSMMNADFSDVKLHTDASANKMADSINAKAFTHEQDIYFGSGHTPENRELLAHELTHTQLHGGTNRMIMRTGDPAEKGTGQTYFSVYVDKDTPKDTPELANLYILMQIFQVSEIEVRQRIDLGFTWTGGFSSFKPEDSGKWMTFGLRAETIEKFADIRPQEKREESGRLEGSAERDSTFKSLSAEMQHAINDEANKRYWSHEGIKPGEQISKTNDPNGIKKKIWFDERDKLIDQYNKIQAIPQRVKDVLFGPVQGAQPVDFEKILELAEKLNKLSDEELALLGRVSSTREATPAEAEVSIDLFIAQLPWVERVREAQNFTWTKGATDEQAIFRALNRPADAVQLMSAMYKKKYHPSDEISMSDDLLGELSGDDAELARALMNRAGLYLPSETLPEWKTSNAVEGIFPQNPFLTTIRSGNDTWYGMRNSCESYRWGILYESGNALIKVDTSIAWQPASTEQLDGNNSLKMKSTDWRFPGIHQVVCRTEQKSGDKTKIVYYSYTQEVRGAEQNIGTMDVQYEIIAHDLAYRDYLDPGTAIPDGLNAEEIIEAANQKVQSQIGMNLMDRWGYSKTVVQRRDDPTGFFAVLFLPKANRLDLNPIIAFRGTDDLPDAVTDSDTVGPGYSQYQINKKQITELIGNANELHPGKKINLTGHSLGGALCQWTATDPDFKGKFDRIITFQAPGISQQRVTDYNTWKPEEKASSVTHHIAQQDIVPMAGEASMPGTFFTHLSQDFAPILSHTHLLLETEAYAGQRKELGITDNLLYSLGFTGSNLPTDRNQVYQTGSFPYPNTRKATEDLRKKVRKEIDEYIERMQKKGELIREYEKRQLEDIIRLKDILQSKKIIF